MTPDLARPAGHGRHHQPDNFGISTASAPSGLLSYAIRPQGKRVNSWERIGSPEMRYIPGLVAILLFSVGFPIRADMPHPRGVEYGKQFDCVDAFDLAMIATTVGCPTHSSGQGSETGFGAAIDRLIEAGFFSSAEFAELTVQWCPLTQAMGFTPNASQIYIDSGLRQGSIDLLAEVLAHEMVHIRQFHQLGARGFKCTYVSAFLSCGGCQTRAHVLEEEAYRFQDTVRERFLEEFLHPASISTSID